VAAELVKMYRIFFNGKKEQQRHEGSKEDRGGKCRQRPTNLEMPTNTLNSVSLNLEAGTNFSAEFNKLFLILLFDIRGDEERGKSGARLMQVRVKSGSIGYLEGSTYGFPMEYLSSIYGVAMGEMRKFHASNRCVIIY
jgi:hypothetical protein